MPILINCCNFPFFRLGMFGYRYIIGKSISNICFRTLPCGDLLSKFEENIIFSNICSDINFSDMNLISWRIDYALTSLSCMISLDTKLYHKLDRDVMLFITSSSTVIFFMFECLITSFHNSVGLLNCAILMPMSKLVEPKPAAWQYVIVLFNKILFRKIDKI